MDADDMIVSAENLAAATGHNDLALLDQHVEAILRTPISDGAIARRMRKRGLLVALPVSLIIGAVTLGDFKTEGWLSAIGLSREGTTGVVQWPAGTKVMPTVRTVPVLQPALPAPPQQIAAISKSENVAPTRSLKRKTPRNRGEPQPKSAELAAAAPVQDMTPTSAPTKEPQPPERMDAVAKAQPVLDTQSRLATIDAIRDLRLK